MEVHQLIVGPLATNCYLLWSGPDREAVIIDPGGDPSIILREIEKRKLKPLAILNTHGHIDHISAAKEIQDILAIPLYLHEDDRTWVDQLKSMALSFGLGAPEKPRIDRLLKNGDKIKLGEDEITVIHTPGHTAGGVTFKVGRALFVGDTLFSGSIGRTDLPGGSYETLISSIKKKLMPLGDDYDVYPGHGPITSLKNEAVFNPFLR
jgi:glyoxylase-like metal-dependent hydrolase (beta-lactamase superfamily II)